MVNDSFIQHTINLKTVEGGKLGDSATIRLTVGIQESHIISFKLALHLWNEEDELVLNSLFYLTCNDLTVLAISVIIEATIQLH